MKPAIVIGIFVGVLLGGLWLIATLVGPAAALLVLGAGSLGGSGLGLLELYLRRKARS